MKIEFIKEFSVNGLIVSVRKIVYCDVYIFVDFDCTSCFTGADSLEDDNKLVFVKKVKEKFKLKMKKVRKILVEKRNVFSVVLIFIIFQFRFVFIEYK